MSAFRSCIYCGTVAHKRLAPQQHGFAYRVFSLCLDVDELDRLDRDLRLFSRNGRNFLSFHDADVGDPAAAAVSTKARRLLSNAGLARYGARIDLVCYPRVLNRVFNPLSVYFCADAAGVIGAIIYEVTNTFGERKSYVIQTDNRLRDVFAQTCAKELYVSPFTLGTGSYSFHVVPPGDRVVVGVAFREGETPILKTHFRGERIPLSDRSIALMLVRHPLMTFKVVGAIHYEAARLWAKGVPLVNRHSSPAYSFTVVHSKPQEIANA